MIQTNDRRKVYTGNGTATVFAGPMAYSADTIAVYFATAGGAMTPQLGGWTLTGVGSPNTTVTFAMAPPTGVTVVILRTVPLTQGTDLANLGPFQPKTIEQALDLGVMQAQQIADDLERAIAGDLIVADFALRDDLASTVAGRGTSLVGYLPPFVAAIARSLTDKLADSVSICDFGASRSGSAAANRIAIQHAIDAGNGSPWSVVVPPGEWIVDLPPNLRKNTTLLLYGNIRNSSGGESPDSCAIAMGSYHPIQAASLTLYTCYDAGPVNEGANNVTLDATNMAAGIAAMPVGTLVYMRSKSCFLSSGAVYPTYAGLAMVTANDGVSKITFSPPVDDSVAALSIGPANDPSIAVDTNSGGLYASYRCAVIGPGGLISDNYYPISRGGRLECIIDVGLLEGHGGHYGNLICHSYQRARNIRARYKIQDIAFVSNNSLFECVTATCDQTAVGIGGMFLFGENARKVSAIYRDVNAPNYTGSTCISFGTGTRGSSLAIDYLYAPQATASLIGVSNVAQTVSGDQVQHATADNVMRFGTVVSGAAARYARFTNDGGMCARNAILSGRFIGAISSDAMMLEGADHYVGPLVRCENGVLNITTGTSNLTCVGAYFAGGLKWTGTTLANANVQFVRSSSSLSLRASYVSGSAVVVTSTAANNTIATSTCPAPSIGAGDKIRFRVSGTITGTAGIKTVQVRAMTASGSSPVTMASWVSAAGDTGDFVLDGAFTVSSNTAYAGATIGSKAGASATVVRLSRTGINLNNNGHKMALEAWVANASDSITIDSYEMYVSRPGGDTP